MLWILLVRRSVGRLLKRFVWRGGMRIKRGESWKEKVNCDEGKDGVKIKGVAESGRLV